MAPSNQLHVIDPNEWWSFCSNHRHYSVDEFWTCKACDKAGKVKGVTWLK